MKTQLTRPQPDHSGPRRPVIRVDHGDTRHAHFGDAYLDRLEAALEQAFSLAFAAARIGGRA